MPIGKYKRGWGHCSVCGRFVGTIGDARRATRHGYKHEVRGNGPQVGRDSGPCLGTGKPARKREDVGG